MSEATHTVSPVATSKPLDLRATRATSPQRIDRILLVLIFLLAAAVRVPALTASGLWVDELFSLATATGHSLEHRAADAVVAQGDYVEDNRARPASEWRSYLVHGNSPAPLARAIRATFRSDTSPPLYYVLLYAWTRAFGTGDVALRGFSLLCGLACLPLIASVARQVGGRRAVLPAAVLFALNPLAAYYSVEGRMYSLVWLLALLTMWASLRIRRRGATAGTLAIWVAVAAAGLLTHYFFVFVLAAAGAWLMLFPGRASRLAIVGAAVVVALLVLPWYVYLPASLHQWRVSEGWLNVRPANFRRLFMLGYLGLSYVSSAGEWGDPLHRTFYFKIPIALAVLCAFGRWRRLLLSRGAVLMWLIAAAAILGPLAFDLARGTYTIRIPRYALGGLPAALVLLGATIGYAHWRSARVALVALMALAWLPGLYLTATNSSRIEEPFREVGAMLSRDLQDGDVVVVHSIPSGVTGIARYVRDPRTPIVSLVSRLRDPQQLPHDLRAITAGARRIVFVHLHAGGDSSDEKRWLDDHAKPVRNITLEKAQILYFTPTAGDTFDIGTDSGDAERVVPSTRS